MRRTVILHIGAAKAGSSSIQMFLRRNHAAFAKLGHVIPDRTLSIGGRVSGDHVLGLKSLAKAGDAATFRAKIDGIVQRAAPDSSTIIISAENLSTKGNSALIAGLTDAYDLRIVMYVRRQDELLAAAWQQWAAKVQTDFDAWLIGALKQYGHWDRILAEWLHHAGRNAMIVRVFDRGSFVNGDLLHDFVDAIGLTDQAGAFDFDQSESNASISDAITPLVSGNRAIFEDMHDNRFHTALVKLTGNSLVDRTKLSLMTRAQRDRVIQHYRATNERVCRAYFPGRPRLFEPVDHAKYRYVAPDQLVDEQLRAIMTIVAPLVRDRTG